MQLKDFKLVVNKQRPELCFQYLIEKDNTVLSIFTSNGGKSYLVSHEERRLDGRFYTEHEARFTTVDECIAFLNKIVVL